MERLRRSSHTYLFAALVIVILGLCLVQPSEAVFLFGGLRQS